HRARRPRCLLDGVPISNCPAPYQIVGGLDDWQTNTKVCNIMKPFTLNGTYGISMQLSGGLSGTYTYSGGPLNAHGSGTYSISLPDRKSTRLNSSHVTTS